MHHYLTADAWQRFWEWLDGLKVRRIPQMCVTGLAGFAVVVGILFLSISQKFDAVPAMRFLVNAIPPLWWGVGFLFAGAFLVAVAWVDFTKAAIPCQVFALGMLLFTVLSVLDVLEGPATGLIAVTSAAIGWFAVCTGLICVAPTAARNIHREDTE